MGYDVGPVTELADKVRAVHDAIQPPASGPMVAFEERDPLQFAGNAGFGEVHPVPETDVESSAPACCEVMLHTAGNPRIPTLGEAMAAGADGPPSALGRGGEGLRRAAVAHLWAVKRRVDA